MHVPWHGSQMNRIQTPVCSTFLWICDAAKRCQSAISWFLHSSDGLAGSVHSLCYSSRGFMWCWGKTPVTVCGCRPMQMCRVFFWQVRFSCCPGVGRDGCPLYRPTRGWGCKTSPESRVVKQNTWGYTPEVLQWDLMGKFLPQTNKVRFPNKELSPIQLNSVGKDWWIGRGH